MTAKQLANWILQQPESIQQGAVTGIVNGHMFSAKRAVAYHSGSASGIYIEPMGTHASNVAGMTFPSNINFYGDITNTPKTIVCEDCGCFDHVGGSERCPISYPYSEPLPSVAKPILTPETDAIRFSSNPREYYDLANRLERERNELRAEVSRLTSDRNCEKRMRQDSEEPK